MYGQSDQTAGSGSHRGYAVYHHKNGDDSYTKYEGTHKRVTKEDGAWESTSEGKAQFVGGTGKFKNIKGISTYNCKFMAEGGGCNVEWEVEY